MSPDSRSSSSAGMAEVSNVGLFGAASTSSVTSASGLMASPSREERMGLHQRVRKRVHLGARVVEPERGTAGGGDAVAGEQRLRAVRAGAHRNALAVDDGGDVVGMRSGHLEGDDGTLPRRGAEDADVVHRAKP